MTENEKTIAGALNAIRGQMPDLEERIREIVREEIEAARPSGFYAGSRFIPPGFAPQPRAEAAVPFPPDETGEPDAPGD